MHVTLDVRRADGGQVSETQGGILMGLRGAAAIEVTLQTLDVDVHSGMKGTTVLPAGYRAGNVQMCMCKLT